MAVSVTKISTYELEGEGDIDDLLYIITDHMFGLRPY
jgi:hypothetical protein